MIRSKSSLFVERWANAEEIGKKLMVVVAVLSVSVCALVLTLIVVIFKPKPIYCIPGLSQRGLAVTPASGSMIANAFAVTWILNWTNFTTATMEETYARTEKFMSPALLAQTLASLKRDLQEAKKNSIASSFSLSEDPLVEEDKNGFWVTVRGQKSIYVGKEAISNQQMTYRLRLHPVNPTDANPYGMIVDRIDQEANGT